MALSPDEAYKRGLADIRKKYLPTIEGLEIVLDYYLTKQCIDDNGRKCNPNYFYVFDNVKTYGLALPDLIKDASTLARRCLSLPDVLLEELLDAYRANGWTVTSKPATHTENDKNIDDIEITFSYKTTQTETTSNTGPLKKPKTGSLKT